MPEPRAEEAYWVAHWRFRNHPFLLAAQNIRQEEGCISAEMLIVVSALPRW